jgi:hypothetical protein
MLTRRRLLILLLATLLLVSVIGWAVWRQMVPQAVSAYERIRLGMTLTEVEQAIGKPPEYRDSFFGFEGELVRQTGVPRKGASFSDLKVEEWWWNDHLIVVAIDDDRKVVGFYLFEQERPSLIEWLQDLVGL